MEITPEVMAALNVLRAAVRRREVPASLKDAINVLDNADVFAEIDQANDYGTEAN